MMETRDEMKINSNEFLSLRAKEKQREQQIKEATPICIMYYFNSLFICII